MTTPSAYLRTYNGSDGSPRHNVVSVALPFTPDEKCTAAQACECVPDAPDNFLEIITRAREATVGNLNLWGIR